MGLLFKLHLPWASGLLIIVIWPGCSFNPESETMYVAIIMAEDILGWDWWRRTSPCLLKTLVSHHPECAPSLLWPEPSFTPFRARP